MIKMLVSRRKSVDGNWSIFYSLLNCGNLFLIFATLAISIALWKYTSCFKNSYIYKYKHRTVAFPKLSPFQLCDHDFYIIYLEGEHIDVYLLPFVSQYIDIYRQYFASLISMLFLFFIYYLNANIAFITGLWWPCIQRPPVLRDHFWRLLQVVS